MIEALHRVLPASNSIITSVYNLTADNVMTALDSQGVKFNVNRLGANDWEIESSEMTDEQILALLHIEDAAHEGELFICTEACTRYGYDPCRCDAKDFKKFVSDYGKEMLFDGDVIVLSEKSRTLTVYHHAGGYVHVKLK